MKVFDTKTTFPNIPHIKLTESPRSVRTVPIVVDGVIDRVI